MSVVSPPSELLSAELLAAMRHLQLRVTRATPLELGLHASRRRAQGLEFAQHRAYAPGDAPRQIDWKLYARSDRLQVRECEADSTLEAWLLLDATASMAIRDEAPPQRSRWSAAQALVAALLTLLWRQGDRFGLAWFGAQQLQWLPAGQGRSHYERCRLALGGIEASGTWPSAERLAPLQAQMRAATLLLWISDGFDADLPAYAEQWSRAGREVRVLQVLTADERDFTFAGGRRFVDPETGAQLLTDAPSARAAYLRDFSVAQQHWHARLRSAGVASLSWAVDQDPLIALRFLCDPRSSGALPEARQ